jgi:uncharacterized protein YndB with AHSA1/START domain
MTGTSSHAPVRKQVRVACEIEEAFRTFTHGIETWWPVETHSITVGEDGSNPPKEIVFESSPGGRVYERSRDGRVCEWATILVFEPPTRVVLEWRVNPARPPTEVEVTFEVDGEGTLVRPEHRGFERDTQEGATWQASYDSGWNAVLDRYTDAAGSG